MDIAKIKDFITGKVRKENESLKKQNEDLKKYYETQIKDLKEELKFSSEENARKSYRIERQQNLRHQTTTERHELLNKIKKIGEEENE